MKVSASGRYAVRSVINLSRTSIGHKSVREVATEEAISLVFLEKIFAKLKKHGIIKSVRGAHGGFSLNKNIDQITILEILLAIGEELSPTPCSTDKCGKECDISYFWTMTREYMEDYFSRITISDIINREIKL